MREPQEEDRGLSHCNGVEWTFKAHGTLLLGSWLQCVNIYSHLAANEVCMAKVIKRSGDIYTPLRHWCIKKGQERREREGKRDFVTFSIAVPFLCIITSSLFWVPSVYQAFHIHSLT